MTYVIKLKCMACSLHFAIYSFYPDWSVKHCPECGSTYPFMVWRDESEAQIFEFVPGMSDLVELGAGTKPLA